MISNDAMTVEYVIDGSRITSLEEFYEEISRVVIPDAYWGRNFDALNDILRGGFGTPREGFTLRWSNSSFSKKKLGYAETITQLEAHLARCPPDHYKSVSMKISDARKSIGPTVFDWLIEIIEDHGEGGTQACDKVRLLLD